MAVQGKSRVEVYYEAWASSLALVLSGLSSVTWQPEPATDSDKYAPILHVRISGGRELNGQQRVGFSEADVAELLRISQQQDPSATTETGLAQEAAIADLVQQWADLAAGALHADFGRLAPQVVLAGC